MGAGQNLAITGYRSARALSTSVAAVVTTTMIAASVDGSTEIPRVASQPTTTATRVLIPDLSRSEMGVSFWSMDCATKGNDCSL